MEQDITEDLNSNISSCIIDSVLPQLGQKAPRTSSK